MILIPQYRTARRVAWTPARLFAASEDGFWLDPSDLSTLWQDTAGTTPAVVGDPVGRIDDKSGNGNNALQATSGNRPILRQDADGSYYLEFDGSNDRLVVTNAMGTQVFACMPILMTAGATKIAYDGITSGNRMCMYRGDSISWGLIYTGPVGLVQEWGIGAAKENTMVQFAGSSTRFDAMNGSTVGIAFSTDSPAGITIGAQYDGSFALLGRVYGAIFVCRVATSDERTSVDGWVHTNWLKDYGKISVVCDGNSLTRGHQATNSGGSYPSQLQSLIGTSYRVVNAGINSQQTTAMTADAVAQIDPLLAWPGGSSTLIAWENTNDIDAGASLATCQSRWNAYFSARQSAGWGSGGTRLVAMTTIARGPFSAGQDTIVADFNTWLRLNYTTYATDLVDLAADARLQTPTNATYFQADQIHLTDAGYGVVAALVDAALFP